MSIPVILDTDIGTDVDDVWALAFLLRCPELDVRLITTSTGDTRHRAALVAKLLGVAGREDVPIGVGLALDPAPLGHTGWLGDYDLADYPGPVYTDGVGAICDTIMNSTETVTVIAIGPLPNLAARWRVNHGSASAVVLLACTAVFGAATLARPRPCENTTSSSTRCHARRSSPHPGTRPSRRWIPAATSCSRESGLQR